MNKYYKGTGKTALGYKIPKFIYTNFSDIPGKEFLIQEGDRLDIIAEQVYGDPTLYKAILLYNNLGDIFEVNPGDIIKLPLDIKKVLERI